MNSRPLRPAALACLAVLLFAAAAFAQPQDPLPECYHTRAEIDSFLIQLEALDTRNYVHIDTIGYSRGDHLGHRYPLYAVWISDNPHVFEDEPVALVIGHIHGEEVVGLEVTLEYMRRMVVNWQQNQALLTLSQMVFVPTMNPDGLQAVADTLDTYYRKNRYVPPELNGRECFVDPGEGGDSCGVDLNRNFGLNWVYGDTLWSLGRDEPLDYYRGPAPFSEPESQAVADLARRIKPTVSVVFHSSRQGGNAERSIAAWAWGLNNEPDRRSSDHRVITMLNEAYCDIFRDLTQRDFHMAMGSQRNGNLQDWFYRELGTIQFNTELGPPRNIQPRCDTLPNLITIDLEPLGWLIRRTINYRPNANEVGLTPLVIHTYDAVTGAPISAEYRNADTWSPLLTPWYTTPEHGRGQLMPWPDDSVHVYVRKEGYVPADTFVNVFPNYNPQNVNIRLQPLPWYNLTVQVRDESGTPIDGRVFIDGEYPRWVDVPAGETVVSLPEGDYRILAEASGTNRLLLWRNFHLTADHRETFYHTATLPVFTEDFEQGLGNWTAGGTGTPWLWGVDTSSAFNGRTLTTQRPGHLQMYSMGMDAWIQYNSAINLGTGSTSVLKFSRFGRLDMPYDSLYVEVSTDGSTWEQAAGFSDLELPWTPSYANLSPWAGETVQLRFRFKTDSTLNDLGVHVDNLAIYTGVDLATPERPRGPVYDWRITGAYPNPFNPATTITYEMAAPGAVTFVVYNLLGEEVRRIDTQALTAGPHHLTWNGTAQSGADVASGLYFVQMQTARKVSTHKLLLIR